MKRIGVIGDKHVGSKYGLNLPEYLSPDQIKSTHCMANYEKWTRVVDWLGKLDYVFDGGDSCDGWNRKEHGDDRTAVEEKQVEINVKLLRMLKGSPKFYFVDGSEYHRGSRKLDTSLANAMGGVEHPDHHTRAPPVFDVRVEDVCFNFAHPITVSKSTWQYQTTPIAREQVLAILNENPADIVLRFHAHYFVYSGYAEHLGVVCPGFQTKTPYQGRISPLGEYRIGAVRFEVHNGEFDWNRLIWKTKTTVVEAQ